MIELKYKIPGVENFDCQRNDYLQVSTSKYSVSEIWVSMKNDYRWNVCRRDDRRWSEGNPFSGDWRDRAKGRSRRRVFREPGISMIKRENSR